MSIKHASTASRRVQRIMAIALMGVVVSLSMGCEPEDRRPGLWLSGDATVFPEDWSFSDQFPEIAIQVSTPYFLPHSVTVWCTQLDGTLYLAAFDPEAKNWPGWVRDDPAIRLKLGDAVYDAVLEELTDAAQISAVQRQYTEKYELQESLPGDPGAIRYWSVGPSSG